MFTGEIVVVKGYQDFEKVIDGKILIIPFSDVGWTTILSQAGAIVSESGGILSHASIIARELSIPAISSVDHACQLKDGLNATVDANNGSLIIEESYVE
jgi:pyruvate,water dikinase